jgi:hypothetical protein
MCARSWNAFLECIVGLFCTLRQGLSNDRFGAAGSVPSRAAIGRVGPLAEATTVFVGHRLVADPKLTGATVSY